MHPPSAFQKMRANRAARRSPGQELRKLYDRIEAIEASMSQEWDGQREAERKRLAAERELAQAGLPGRWRWPFRSAAQ